MSKSKDSSRFGTLLRDLTPFVGVEIQKDQILFEFAVGPSAEWKIAQFILLSSSRYQLKEWKEFELALQGLSDYDEISLENESLFSPNEEGDDSLETHSCMVASPKRGSLSIRSYVGDQDVVLSRLPLEPFRLGLATAFRQIVLTLQKE